jgi:hypothetical protein
MYFGLLVLATVRITTLFLSRIGPSAGFGPPLGCRECFCCLGKVRGGWAYPESCRKNASTLWREAQLDVADPLEVIEQVMLYFYGLGVHGAKNKAPIDDVQKCFNKALYAASLAAPYRHARLSAVKNIDNNELLEGVPADATPDELRVILAQRIAKLRDGGYFDVNALPPPPEPAAST